VILSCVSEEIGSRVPRSNCRSYRTPIWGSLYLRSEDASWSLREALGQVIILVARPLPLMQQLSMMTISPA
jgi:hypothetical protein